MVDICPVGALTDRDFRFQVRVWYLDTAKSICTGCARGCNIDVHVNRRRPHHAEGRRVARLKPRFNADVNTWWICDEGRYGFGCVDAPTPGMPTGAARGRSRRWDDAVAACDALRRYAPDEIAVLASPQMANEDLMALQRLLEHRGIRQVAFAVPPAVPGRRRRFPAARRPQSQHAAAPSCSAWAATRRRCSRPRARAGVRCLWVFDHDLLASGLPAADVSAALGRVETVIFAGTNANATSARAHWVLPAAAWVEREGTFTNFEGRVQRFRTGRRAARRRRCPAWDLLGHVLAALGGTPAGDAGRALVPRARRARCPPSRA